MRLLYATPEYVLSSGVKVCYCCTPAHLELVGEVSLIIVSCRHRSPFHLMCKYPPAPPPRGTPPGQLTTAAVGLQATAVAFSVANVLYTAGGATELRWCRCREMQYWHAALFVLVFCRRHSIIAWLFGTVYVWSDRTAARVHLLAKSLITRSRRKWRWSHDHD